MKVNATHRAAKSTTRGLGLGLGLMALLAGCAQRVQPPPPLLVTTLPPVIYSWQMAPNTAPPADTPPSYLVLLPNADGSTGRVLFQNPQGRQTLNRPKQGAGLDGAAPPFPVTDAQLQRDFGPVMAARPPLPEHYRIYFTPGGSRLTSESLGIFNTIIQRSQVFSALEVSVIGHTDSKGSADANYALGLRRARTLAEMLVEQGIRAEGIEIGSEGEDMR